MLAAEFITVALAKLVAFPGVIRAALSVFTCALARRTEGWVGSPGILWAAFFVTFTNSAESLVVSPGVTFAASKV